MSTQSSIQLPVQGTLFTGGFSLRALLRKDEPLFRIEEYLDFKPLEAIAASIWRGGAESKSNRGRKPWPVEVMFRVILLKHLFNRADETLEREIYNNIAYRCFAGLGLFKAVPDSRTIWLYNEVLAQNNAGQKLFDTFKTQLQKNGLLVKEGKIVDATFTLVPVQRNTKEENETIKKGGIPQAWEKQPRKSVQKDTDARWTKKNDVSYFGCKDHIASGRRTKFIHSFSATDASVHDSQELQNLIKANDISVHADSAYRSGESAELLEKLGVENQIMERAYREHPLSGEQIERNHSKSKIRVRVEHVFAMTENSMGGHIQPLHLFCPKSFCDWNAQLSLQRQTRDCAAQQTERRIGRNSPTRKIRPRSIVNPRAYWLSESRIEIRSPKFSPKNIAPAKRNSKAEVSHLEKTQGLKSKNNVWWILIFRNALV
jgi:IS5 family transposase